MLSSIDLLLVNLLSVLGSIAPSVSLSVCRASSNEFPTTFGSLSYVEHRRMSCIRFLSILLILEFINISSTVVKRQLFLYYIFSHASHVIDYCNMEHCLHYTH